MMLCGIQLEKVTVAWRQLIQEMISTFARGIFIETLGTSFRNLSGYAPYAVGKILYDDEAADNDFTIQFAHGLKRSVPIDKVCWIPSVLYDRIVAELKSPQE